MRRLILMAVAVIAAVLLPGSVMGGAGSVGIFSHPTATGCTILDSPGIVLLYVVHTGSDGTMGSKFAAPLSPCWAGATHLVDNVQSPVFIGDSQSGIEIVYGACLSGPVHVMTIWVSATGSTVGCCLYSVQAHPAAALGEVESTNCSGQVEPAAGGSAIVSTNPALCPCGFNSPPPIENPSPPDRAAGILTTTHLSWNPASMPDPVYRVWLDTDPFWPMPIVADGLTEETVDPGPLQPNTTYYWSVRGCPPHPIGPGCEYSPIWIFKTTGPVDTETRTWGAIKELFRVEPLVR